MNIKVKHTHLKSQASSSQRPSRSRLTNNPQHQTSTPPHPTAKRLHGAEPTRSRKGVMGQQMSPSQQPKKQRHNSISDLLRTWGVHVDESETEIGSQGWVNRPVWWTEAENELPWLEPALCSLPGSWGRWLRGVVAVATLAMWWRSSDWWPSSSVSRVQISIGWDEVKSRAHPSFSLYSNFSILN